MNKHLFIFQWGIWLGEGGILFTGAKDAVKFFTRWKVDLLEPTKIVVQQEIEIFGVEERRINNYIFSEIKEGSFHVTLENESMGKVSGKGVLDEHTIAWELRDHPGLEGYEVYNLQENGDYTFSAEYASDQNYRSLIQGKVWRKAL